MVDKDRKEEDARAILDENCVQDCRKVPGTEVEAETQQTLNG